MQVYICTPEQPGPRRCRSSQGSPQPPLWPGRSCHPVLSPTPASIKLIAYKVCARRMERNTCWYIYTELMSQSLGRSGNLLAANNFLMRRRGGSSCQRNTAKPNMTSPAPHYRTVHVNTSCVTVYRLCYQHGWKNISFKIFVTFASSSNGGKWSFIFSTGSPDAGKVVIL